MELKLQGYRYSVYTWIVRMALAECGVAYGYDEFDPFVDGAVGLHPFGRVPVLAHDGFVVYETAAILRYADQEFAKGRLTPADAAAAARMQQVIGIADSYAYWPLVRQVFSNAVFAPRTGAVTDVAALTEGLARAPKPLAELERICCEGVVLNQRAVGLADIYLAPMISYFVETEAGAALLAQTPALSRWWTWISARPSFVETKPVLPPLAQP
jgi:glutathione S-transferase